MGTREVYEEKLRTGNLYHEPTIKPGLGTPRCPRCLSPLKSNSVCASFFFVESFITSDSRFLFWSHRMILSWLIVLRLVLLNAGERRMDSYTSYTWCHRSGNKTLFWFSVHSLNFNSNSWLIDFYTILDRVTEDLYMDVKTEYLFDQSKLAE